MGKILQILIILCPLGSGKNQTLAALALLVRRINYKRFVYILIIEYH